MWQHVDCAFSSLLVSATLDEGVADWKFSFLIMYSLWLIWEISCHWLLGGGVSCGVLSKWLAGKLRAAEITASPLLFEHRQNDLSNGLGSPVQSEPKIMEHLPCGSPWKISVFFLLSDKNTGCNWLLLKLDSERCFLKHTVSWCAPSLLPAQHGLPCWMSFSKERI